ncbi:MAG: hypothetical protein FWG18_00855 [Alphaproteobacteria bacterium]|nr:hypothetical protein [Alphaproteobacteria bacterium]
MKLPEDIFEPVTTEQKVFNTKKLVEKMSVENNKEFAKYLTGAFIRTMKLPDIAPRILGWDSMPTETRVDFAQLFMDKLIDVINADINEEKIPLINFDKDKFKKISDLGLSEVFKEKLRLPKMKVTHAVGAKLMVVAPTRDLFINFDFPMYKGVDNFLLDLRHESGHVIDLFSDISPLSMDVRLGAMRNYGQEDELWTINPLELNTNISRHEDAQAIRKAIEEIKTMHQNKTFEFAVESQTY